MSEGGTQYDLKLGLDTGPAKPGVASLAADLVKTGEAADKVQDKLTAASAASGKMGASAKSAGASAASAATSNDKLATSAAHSDAAVTKASAALGKTTTAATAASAGLGKAATATSNLGTAAGASGPLITRATTATDQFSAASHRSTSSLIGLGRGLLVAVGLYASLGQTIQVVAASTRAAEAWSKSILQVTTLADVSRKTVVAWEEDLKRTSALTGRLPGEMAAGLLRVTSAGLRGNEALAITQASAKAAALGLGQVDSVAQTVAATMNAYGKETLSAERATDILLQTVIEGAAEASELAPVLGRVVGIAQQVGVSFEEVGAFIATFTRLGVDADEAVTALRGTLTTLLGPTKQQEEALKLVGLSMAGLREEITTKGLMPALVDLVARFKGNEDALSLIIPNVRALAGVLGTAGAQGTAYAQVLANIEGSSGTLDRKFQELQNNPAFRAEQARAGWALFQQELGGPVLGAVLDVVRAIDQGLGGDSMAVGRRLGEAIANGINALIPVVRTVAENFDVLKNALLAFLAVKFSAWIAGAVAELAIWLGTITGTTAALAAKTVATLADAAAVTAAAQADAVAAAAKVAILQETIALGAAVAAETVIVGEAATVLDFYAASVTAAGVAVARTGTVTDLYTTELIRHDAAVAAAATAQAGLATANAATAASEAQLMAAMHAEALAMDKARSSGAGFLSLAITPLTIGLGLLLGALLLVNDKLVEFSRNTQAEIESMVRSTNDLGAAVAKIRKDTSELISEARFQERLADDLRASGVKAGSPEAIEKETRLRADQQRQMVAGWREQKTALDEHRQSLASYRTQLDAAIQAEGKLRFKTQAEEDRARLVAVGAGTGSTETAGITDRVRKLDAAREKIQQLQLSANEARVNVGELTKSTTTLTNATEGYVAPAEQVNRSLGDLAGKADKAGQKVGNLTAQIDAATQSNNLIAAAYGRSTEEGRKAEEAAELLSRKLQAASGVEEKYRANIEGRVEAQVRSERGAAGSKTIANLNDQIAAAQKLAAAYDSGLQPAIEEARREQDLLQQRLANASGAADEQVDTIGDLTGRLAELNQSNAFASQTDQMEESNRVLGDAAKRWDGTSISIEQTNIALQVHNQIAQATIGKTTDEAAALGRLIREHERLSAVMEARLRLGRLEEETRKTRELAAVKRDDFLTEREYQNALAAVNTEHEVRSALIALEANRYQALINIKREDFKLEEDYKRAVADTGALFDDYAKRTEATIREQAALNRETSEYISLVRIVATAGNAAFQTVKDSIRDVLTQAIQEGSVNWESIWDSLTDRLLGIFLDMLEEMLNRWIATQAAMAAVSAAAGTSGGAGAGGAGGLFQSLGGAFFSNTGVGSSIMGNPMTGGNSFLGGSGSGAVGAGVFAVVAAILINQIKQEGRSHARTQIDFGGSQGLSIGTPPGGSWNGNGDPKNVAQTLAGAQEIIKRITEFIQGLGGEIDRMAEASSSLTVGKVGQGKKSRWYVTYANGLVKEFGRDMEAALDFAMVQAIRQAPTRGLSPEVVAALKNTAAEKMEQLQKDIDVAMSAVRARLGQTGSQVYDTVRGYQDQIRAAEKLGISTQALVAARDREIQSIRNQMMGLDTSTSDFLASLLSFNAGIEESTRLIRQQTEEQLQRAQAQLDRLLTEGGPQPRDDQDGRVFALSQEQWERQIARLRESITRYTQELDKIPQALSDQELSMAIFDSLYKYLEGNKKYAEQAHKYAILRVELEFAAIQAQLVALGRWEEFAGMWQDALNAAREAAGKPAGRGGRGGGATKEDRADFLKELDVIARGALPESVQQVLALGDQLDEMSKRAKELKVSEARLAAARQALIDQQKTSILDPVREFLIPQEGGTFGLSQWDTAEAEIRQKFDDARAANQALIDEVSQRAIAFWRLNAAELRALHQLAESAIDALGLPAEGARDKIDNLRKTLDFLARSVVAGTLAAERFDAVVGELGNQARVEVLSLMGSILNQMGATAQNDQVQRDLREANFIMEVAQLNFLYTQYVALGLIAGETRDRLDDLLGFINDRGNWPDFNVPTTPPPGPRFQGYDDAPQTGGSAADPLADLRAQIAEWNELQFGEVTRRARELRAALDDLVERFGTSAELSSAWGIAVEDFVDESLRDFERLGRNPLALELQDIVDQFADLRTALVTVGASAEQMARLEEARTLALADFWRRATEGIQGLIEELRASDPHTSSQARFLDARQEFRDLLARAQGGDLEAVQQLQEAASQYRQQALDFLGGGVGSQAALDEILAGLEGVADMGPALDPVIGQLAETNDLLAQIRDGIAVWLPGDGGAASRASERSSESSSSSRSTAGSGADHASASGLAASPPILRLPDGDGGGKSSPELIGLIRRLEERERKKAEGSTRREGAERARRAREDQDRERLLEVLGSVATAVEGLKNQLRKNPNLAGG